MISSYLVMSQCKHEYPGAEKKNEAFSKTQGTMVPVLGRTYYSCRCSPRLGRQPGSFPGWPMVARPFVNMINHRHLYVSTVGKPVMGSFAEPRAAGSGITTCLLVFCPPPDTGFSVLPDIPRVVPCLHQRLGIGTGLQYRDEMNWG